MSKATNTARGPDTPQMRRRKSMARKTLFSVSKAGPEVIRKFGVRQRLGFAAMVLVALGAMTAAALLADRVATGLFWYVEGAGVILSLGSFLIAKRFWLIQFALLTLGLSAIALGLGLLVPPGPAALAMALNPVLVVGITLLGAAINGLWLGLDRGPAFELAMAGPWLAAALAAAWFFPAGEWLLALSGLVALFLLYCLIRAIREAPPRYQPGQALAAAAGVFALAGQATFRWFLR